MGNVLVLTVPDFEVIKVGHLAENLQIVDFVLNSLAQRLLIPARAGLVL